MWGVQVRPTKAQELCQNCKHACSYLFAGLPESARMELAALMHPITLDAGELVFYEGLPAHGLYVLCEGKIKLAKRVKGGRSQMLKLLAPGEVLGEKTLFDQETYTCYAKALEPSRLMFIARADFLAFLRKYPDVAIRLIEKLSRELKAFGDKLVEISAYSAKERMARVLLELAQAFGYKTPQGLDIGVELPRGELAEMVGVSTETAVRILSEFKERGIIALPGRRILILQLEELQALAHPFRTFLRENLL
ncbi:MAG: Crp/Fnr family transcriptional regulator [Candidatus Bipolaricaulota bacterium]|nr:Crp/Fnr family transcriptional regulator [Candidatus Bipolaricaulota bacterium]MDW8126361.1 Crp/Fnr family transcriptional regulator [Candidatus Bipolaricaulota bacterium]